MPSAKLKNTLHSHSETCVATEKQTTTKNVLLSDAEGQSELSSDSDTSGGVLLEDATSDTSGSAFTGFTINEEYARRFEHNHKRAEKHRLEEKYGKESRRPLQNGALVNLSDGQDDSDISTDSEEEDDEGILALGALDEQVNATLHAIRAKDPRVYDEKSTFYTGIEDEELDASSTTSKAKPMYLRDYHREILLGGDLDGDENRRSPPSYAQQQKDLRSTIAREMHAAADDSNLHSEHSLDSGDSQDDGFLVRKTKTKNGQTCSRGTATLESVDVTSADKDPETFLSNFMAARAWVPSIKSQFQPFESDDEEEERRAEEFEEAYNLRFENPQVSNEKLRSHARNIGGKSSVRRESPNSRKKARDLMQTKKEIEKQVREQEKARLRRLRLEEAEKKLKKIKKAAGLRGKVLKEEEWVKFLDEGWDDERWKQEMNKHFGDDYYADPEANISSKKPKWKDDIDINDIVPDFDAENVEKYKFILSDDATDAVASDGEHDEATTQASPDAKSHKRKKDEERKQARKEHRKIAELVEEKLSVELALSGPSKKRSYFRYRETSPSTYGLTAHDILMASDSQLNQYAGLKKLATFRDAEKKRKDRKRLGKKARLREWRKETFGSEKGPQKSLGEVIAQETSMVRPTYSAESPEALHEEKRKRAKRVKSGKAEA
ncbi:MAG: hypothetical protein Q9187_004042 [Circinaria calcarea]